MSTVRCEPASTNDAFIVPTGLTSNDLSMSRPSGAWSSMEGSSLTSVSHASSSMSSSSDEKDVGFPCRCGTMYGLALATWRRNLAFDACIIALVDRD